MNPSTRMAWKKANAICGFRARRGHRPRRLLFFIPLPPLQELYRPGPRRKGDGFASLRALGRSGPGRGAGSTTRGNGGGRVVSPVEISRRLVPVAGFGDTARASPGPGIHLPRSAASSPTVNLHSRARFRRPGFYKTDCRHPNVRFSCYPVDLFSGLPAIRLTG